MPQVFGYFGIRHNAHTLHDRATRSAKTLHLKINRKKKKRLALPVLSKRHCARQNTKACNTSDLKMTLQNRDSLQGRHAVQRDIQTHEKFRNERVVHYAV